MAIVFRGGLPYGPDIEKLQAAFPLESLTEGRRIAHEELEAAISYQRRQPRYGGVVNSWLRLLDSKHGVVVRWEPGFGIVVLDPTAVSAFAETRTKQKIGQLSKAVKIFGKVDRARLDTTAQARFDHQLRVATALESATKNAKKQMAIDLPPGKPLPKRLPTSGASALTQ